MANNQHAAPAPVGGSLVNAVTLSCGVLIALLAAILVVRFLFGLGAVTGLNDGYPWGIWIVIDVVIGSANDQAQIHRDIAGDVREGQVIDIARHQVEFQIVSQVP